MTRSADPTLKALVEASPADWLPLLRVPPARVSVIDADVASVVSGAADKVLLVHGEPEYLLHLEFQVGHFEATVPRRLRFYNGLLDYRHDLPVRSVLVLLKPEADSPQLLGLIERSWPGETPYATLRYDILRVWQVPAEQLLAGGLGTLPLAPLGAVAPADLPDVVCRLRDRLTASPESRWVHELGTASFLLLGVRYSDEIAEVLMGDFMSFLEGNSTTYDAILRKGALKGRREMLLRQGRVRMGAPDKKIIAAVNSIDDLERLDALAERVLVAGSWAELLEPVRKPRKRSPR
jgi:hypothetical protein